MLPISKGNWDISKKGKNMPTQKLLHRLMHGKET